MGSSLLKVFELENIRLWRRETQILRNISWRIRRGGHWALLGANGSGKTTLLRVVGGQLWPSEGDVYVLGQRFGECNLPELRKVIGCVSSSVEHDLPERDRAQEVVLSGLEATLGLFREYNGAERARAHAALSAVGGGEFAGRDYGVLSQGERQRVLIARALVSRPHLLILDEPCAGLDPAAREDLLADLARLAMSADAPTLVFATHHVEELGPWITHALVLESGRALAAGPIDEVLTDAHLSRAFGRSCRIEREAERRVLRLEGKPSR